MAVVFNRISDLSVKGTISLPCTKKRVKLLKAKMSLLKLELSAAYLLAELMHLVRTTITLA